MLAQVTAKLVDGDSYSAIDLIHSQGGDATAVARRYSQLVKDLYWADKNARNLGIVGRAGILFCLAKAHGAGRGESEEMKSWAKTIAYDVAANSWPGWGDAGVVISEAEMAGGFEAAQLNLRLAIELRKPAIKVSMAHWLVGAHQLAAGIPGAAIQNFETARSLASQAGDSGQASLNEGFIAIARMLLKEPDANESLGKTIRELEATGNKDAKFYAQQLATARRILVK